MIVECFILIISCLHRITILSIKSFVLRSDNAHGLVYVLALGQGQEKIMFQLT